MKFDKKFDSPMGQGGEKFLKLKSGESINGVFRGEIHSYFIKWNNGRFELPKRAK